jgi:lysozyme
MNAHGADFSLWNDDNSTAQPVDFARAQAAGLSFAYIKASQATFADPDYTTNWYNAKGNVYRGAYHFLTWERPIDQARFFWGLLKADRGELPPMVDFEWWSTIPAGALVYLRAFVDEFYALSGIRCGIYTARSFWLQYGATDPYWAQYPLWLCDIEGAVEVPKPWTKWTFHQYTFKLPGPAYGAESADLDGDWYNGSEADMMARYSLAPLGQPEPVGIPLTVRQSSINIRTQPTITSAIVGALGFGERVAVTEMHEAEGYQWGKHSRGWSVVDTGNWWMEP